MKPMKAPIALLALFTILNVQPVIAGDTLGKVLAIDKEKQLVTIDGAVFAIMPDALTNDDTLQSLRPGTVVQYSERGGRITSITPMKHLRDVPQ